MRERKLRPMLPSSVKRTTVLVVVALGVALFFGWREWRLHISQVPFDADAWKAADHVWGSPQTPTIRHQMMRDLITNVLPGNDRAQIEELLGTSATHAEMRRYTDADLSKPPVRKPNGEYEPIPRTGEGWYFEEHDWDLIYPIGKELVFIYDHRWVMGAAYSPDDEYLILRVDPKGRYSSWFVVGSSRWPDIVGEPGRQQYRMTRQ